MDSTLRGGFPIAQGIALAAAAFFAAWIVNHLDESSLEESEPNLDGVRMGRLLGMPEHGLPDARDKFEFRLNIGKSALRLRLLGTLTSAIPEWTIASILDLQSQTSHTYRDGDAVRGAEIVDGSVLNNIETGLALFTRLRDSSRIDVDIRRNGSTFRRMYWIR